MAKATLNLPNGTLVTLEGPPEEIKQLLEAYSGASTTDNSSQSTARRSRKSAPRARTKVSAARKDDESKPDLNAIVTLVKDCDEAEAIETQILDRTAQVDRALLALYIVHEYLDNAYGLTSGDVKKVTTDLGIPISQPNASRTLSGTASKYVIGDKVKVKGQAVRYKLSRRGVQYMKGVLTGSNSD